MGEKNYYCHPDGCIIERTVRENGEATAELLDGEGDTLWAFPGDWTDAQIMTALAFANHAYAKGEWVGEYRKLREIKKALELPL